MNKKLAKLHPFFGELQNGSRTPFLAFNECEQSMKAWQSSFHSILKSLIKVSHYKNASEASYLILTPFHLIKIHFYGLQNVFNPCCRDKNPILPLFFGLLAKILSSLRSQIDAKLMRQLCFISNTVSSPKLFWHEH